MYIAVPKEIEGREQSLSSTYSPGIQRHLPSQKFPTPPDKQEAKEWTGSYSPSHSCLTEDITLVEVYTFHTILPAWLVKQMQLSLGHVTIGSNQMTQKHLSHGVIGHCEKLHPQDECPLLPGYMSPLFSCVHVGCMLSFDPWHHLWWSNILKSVMISRIFCS